MGAYMNIKNITTKNKKIVAVAGFGILLIVSAFIIAGSGRINDASVDTQLSQFSDKKQVNESTGDESDSLLGSAASAKKKCVLTLTLVPQAITVASAGTNSYAMTIKNKGTSSCTNTSVSVYYSENETFASAAPTPTASNYYWNIGTLASKASKIVTITTIAQNSGDIDTEACATANNGKDACATSHVTITGGTTPPPTGTGGTGGSTPSITGEYGTWVWVSPLQMSETYINTIVAAAKANGINVLYVTIDDYLSIAALADGAIKTAKKAEYSTALEKVVRIAGDEGIAVDAEAGWRDWAHENMKYKAFAIVDYVLEYNATHSHKLRGFQYDVEPYLLSTYENNKAGELTPFVALIDETAEKLGASSIRFNVVIPHFYDDAQAWTPAITYGGITTHTFNHLLRILDTRPGSSITLMSYRDFAEGANGTIQISEVEINQASTGSHSTKVIVAQETGNVDPDYVTFYNQPKAYYLEQIGIINNAFANKSGYGGMAVHYIDPFLELQ